MQIHIIHIRIYIYIYVYIVLYCISVICYICMQLYYTLYYTVRVSAHRLKYWEILAVIFEVRYLQIFGALTEVRFKELAVTSEESHWIPWNPIKSHWITIESPLNLLTLGSAVWILSERSVMPDGTRTSWPDGLTIWQTRPARALKGVLDAWLRIRNGGLIMSKQQENHCFRVRNLQNIW